MPLAVTIKPFDNSPLYSMINLLAGLHCTTGGHGAVIHSTVTISHWSVPHPPLLSSHDCAQYGRPVSEYM